MNKRKRRSVYVVEIHFNEWRERDRWEPCAAAGVTRSSALNLMRREWSGRNAGTRVRVTRYVRADGAA